VGGVQEGMTNGEEDGKLLIIPDAPYTSQVLLPCDLNTYA